MANVPNQGVSQFAASLAEFEPTRSGSSVVLDDRLITLDIPYATFSGTIGNTFKPSEAKCEVITPPIAVGKSGPNKGLPVKAYIKREQIKSLACCKVNMGKGLLVDGLSVTAPAYVFTSRGIVIDGGKVTAAAKGTGKASAKASEPTLRKTRQAGSKHADSGTTMLSPAAAAVADVPVKSAEDIAAEIATQKVARLNTMQA